MNILLQDLVEEMFDFHFSPIRYFLDIMKPDEMKNFKIFKNKENKLTSSPVPASISRKRSTKVRTSLAAFALLTSPRNGRVILINDAKALKIILLKN